MHHSIIIVYFRPIVNHFSQAFEKRIFFCKKIVKAIPFFVGMWYTIF